MARPIKKGLDYFPFGTNFFQDLKIRKLIRYQSGKAISVYTLLLCNIYENGYYVKWDEELPFVISEQLGYEEGYISEVIKCCLSIGLFSQSLFDQEKVLTSAGIQNRYLEAKRSGKIEKHRVIVVETQVNASKTTVINAITDVNAVESTQSKVKEIKEEKTKGNYFRIREKIFHEKVSDFFKSNFQSQVENWAMSHDKSLMPAAFEKMDTDYFGYHFNNENHIYNAFKTTYGKVEKEKSSAPKEKTYHAHVEKVVDNLNIGAQKIREKHATGEK